MRPKLIDELDSRFFQTIRSPASEAYKNIPELFDCKTGLSEEELFNGDNVEALKYLFNISALAVSSPSSGILHPIITVPSVGDLTIYTFLKNRLEHYSKQDQEIRFVAVDCKTLIGRSILRSDATNSIEIPNLIKWRIEHEAGSFGTKLFLLYDVASVVASESLTLKEVITELHSISEDASFIVFLTPSAFYFVKASLSEEEFTSRFARTRFFEGFKKTDIQLFKKFVSTRLKNVDSIANLKFDELGLELALTDSRGIPFYACKIIEETIRRSLFEDLNEVQLDKFIAAKKELGLDALWQTVDALTLGQIDILVVLTTFNEGQATIYEIKDRLRTFRKSSGDRSAILQQIRRLYENNLLDRVRPTGSRHVYYKIRQMALPAIEHKIKEILEGVR